MEELDDIFLKLITSCADLSKKTLCKVGEFFPICFYYLNGEYKSLSIAEWNDSANKYGNELIKILKSENVSSYSLAKNVVIKNEKSESIDAIEISLVNNEDEYEKSYIFYSKNEKGEYIFSELIAELGLEVNQEKENLDEGEQNFKV